MYQNIIHIEIYKYRYIYTYIYKHIGIYIYKVAYLKKFVQLRQTQNEKIQKLEQLRLIDNKISIDVCLAKTRPIGVDTHEDYLELKKIMEYKT